MYYFYATRKKTVEQECMFLMYILSSTLPFAQKDQTDVNNSNSISTDLLKQEKLTCEHELHTLLKVRACAVKNRVEKKPTRKVRLHLALTPPQSSSVALGSQKQKIEIFFSSLFDRVL